MCFSCFQYKNIVGLFKGVYGEVQANVYLMSVHPLSFRSLLRLWSPCSQLEMFGTETINPFENTILEKKQNRYFYEHRALCDQTL